MNFTQIKYKNRTFFIVVVSDIFAQLYGVLGSEL